MDNVKIDKTLDPND